METPENLAIQSELALTDATQPTQDVLNASNLDSSVLEEENIRLLAERLVVNRSKRKVGEVIIRKEIETRMVQVPVKYEKLIVEQVSPEHKQLVEIELGQQEIEGVELTATSLGEGFTVTGDFNSPKIASLVLNAIALERTHGCKKIRVEILVENVERQKIYQEWFERSSINPPLK